MKNEDRNELGETLEEFLDNYDPSLFERPSVTVDTLIFTKRNRKLQVLLIKRKNHPEINRWALPGGFVEMDENLEDAARRELREETGIEDSGRMMQLYTWGDVGRDPRTRIITVSYIALVEWDEVILKAGDDAKDVGWFDIDKLPSLAFDHSKILEYGIDFLRSKKFID